MKLATVRCAKAIYEVQFNGGFRVASFKQAGEHTIYEAAARQRRNLLAGEERAVKRMIGAWKVAQGGIKAKLDAVTLRIEQAQLEGEPVSPAWLYQQDRWQQFLVQIQVEIDKYSKVAAKVTKDQQYSSAIQGGADSAELVVSAGVKGGFKMLPKSQLVEIVGQLTDKSPLYDLFNALGSQSVAKAREIFAVGIAAGENPRKIAERFQAELNMTKQRSVVIARQESLRAYRNSQQLNYAANPDVVVGVRISCSRDRRTCAICWAHDGTILKHGEPFASHVCCRCALLPVVKYLDEPRGTGEEALKQQSEEVQRNVLGPGRLALWKAGKISLGDLTTIVDHPRWGLSKKLKTLDELETEIKAGVKTNPAAVTSVEGMGLVAKAHPLLTGATSAPSQSLIDSIDEQLLKEVEAEAASPLVLPTIKAKTANDYAEQLVQLAGAHLTPAEVLKATKTAFPKTIFEEKHIVAKYKKFGITPAATPVATSAPVVQPTVPEPPKPVSVADNILAHKTGEAAGTNAGGFYLGADGVQRYVKFYGDPAQAYNEFLANEVYRRLGLNAPKSVLFEHAGGLAYASDLLPVEGTIGKVGLTQEVAKKFLDGFAADVLLANWDAVGLEFDNVVKLTSGEVARIDNGGSLLFRARAGRKPIALLKTISEYDGFYNATLNPNYRKMFTAAGIAGPDKLGQTLVDQVEKITTLRKEIGSWHTFVKSATPGLSQAEQTLLADMLESRTNLLQARAQQIREQLNAPKVKPPVKRKSAKDSMAIALKGDKPIGKADVVTWDQTVQRKLLYSGVEREAFYQRIFGDDQMWAEFKSWASNWTGSSSAKASLQMADSIEKALTGTVTTGTTDGEQFLGLAKWMIATRRERWERLAAEIGLDGVPTSFHSFRGTHDTIFTEYAISAWAADAEWFEVPQRRLASWSLWGTRTDGKSGAVPFYGRRKGSGGRYTTGVMWEADVPFEQTFFDKWVDDAAFLTQFDQEAEVIAGDGRPNAVRANVKDLKIWFYGREYKYSEREELFQAYERKFGRKPRAIDNYQVKGETIFTLGDTPVRKVAAFAVDGNVTGLAASEVDSRVETVKATLSAIRELHDAQGTVKVPSWVNARFGPFAEDRQWYEKFKTVNGIK